MSYKEIVTKAVIGKGKKLSVNQITIIPEQSPNTVLGCWVINHIFKGSKSQDAILIEGSYDINVWYSYDNDSKTAVSNYKYTYNEKHNVKIKSDSELNNSSEIIVRSLKQPSVKEVKIVNGSLFLEIEKELGIEIVGDTMVKVSVEDDFDDYEIIEDEVEMNKEIENTIDNEVKEDYLN